LPAFTVSANFVGCTGGTVDLTALVAGVFVFDADGFGWFLEPALACALEGIAVANWYNSRELLTSGVRASHKVCSVVEAAEPVTVPRTVTGC